MKSQITDGHFLLIELMDEELWPGRFTSRILCGSETMFLFLLIAFLSALIHSIKKEKGIYFCNCLSHTHCSVSFSLHHKYISSAREEWLQIQMHYGTMGLLDPLFYAHKPWLCTSTGPVRAVTRGTCYTSAPRHITSQVFHSHSKWAFWLISHYFFNLTNYKTTSHHVLGYAYAQYSTYIDFWMISLGTEVSTTLGADCI